MNVVTTLRRVPTTARKVSRHGFRGTVRAVVALLHRRLDEAGASEMLDPQDQADSTRLPSAPNGPVVVRGPAVVGWVIAPPGAGSGGHTTLFRMVTELERQGHTCRLYLYDRRGVDVNAARATIRSGWPDVRADVVDVADGMRGAQAYVASGWETAHVLATRGAGIPGRRLYFVQDYEPWFHPRGATYALAEDSYRFGYRTIALGRMVAGLLRAEIGLDPDVVEFGCDTTTYRLLPETGRPRRGVVFYAKPGNDRRGFDLAVSALKVFHQANPDVPIHAYGDLDKALPFPAVKHGRLTPRALNELYNGVRAGIALSFTNISLVAEELVAAGVIPVVNDAPSARADIPSPFVQWARATPGGIAAALARASRSEAYTPAAVAMSARRGWDETARRVTEIVLDELGSGARRANDVIVKADR